VKTGRKFITHVRSVGGRSDAR